MFVFGKKHFVNKEIGKKGDFSFGFLTFLMPALNADYHLLYRL